MGIKANVRSIEAAKPGRHQVEGVTGLYLHVGESGQRRWLFRYHRANGKANEPGLGTLADVPLARAKERAVELRAMVKSGTDPVAHKRMVKMRQVVEGKTFCDVLDLYSKAFATRKGAQDVVALVNRHATLLMGMPINAITVDDVEQVVEPVNKVTPKTGRRLLGALSIVLSFAKAKRLREGDDPAAWATWKFLIPSPPPADNYSSMPSHEVPQYYRRLLLKDSTTSLCLAFLILNAKRGCEVLGLKWSDIDAAKAMIVFPATRMKARREHKIPLSREAQAILTTMRTRFPSSEFVFPAAHGGQLSGRVLDGMLRKRMGQSYSVHGFRGSFSTWAHGATGFEFQHELIELSLAHAEGRGNAVSRSYNHTDAVERRRPLMSAWGEFVGGAQGEQRGAAMVLEEAE
jgi:integrase